MFLKTRAVAAALFALLLVAGMTGFFLPQLTVSGAAPDTANDWPMWRYDAQRRAATPMALNRNLHLQWTLELPEPVQGWRPQGDNADKLDYDVSYSPIVTGQTMLIASMVNDTLTAYDTRTGGEKWRFYADGPTRLAPAVHAGKVYAVSDDGFLYCLEVETGAEVWRFRGGPEDRRLLGNERLINMWPARGGPVIHDGRVFFAASVWPLMGTFIHALDAETGEPVWTNSSSGSRYYLHPHGGAYSFGGVAPQGYLAASEDALIVSGGRSTPAVHDLATGDFRYFRHATNITGKGAGGYRVGVQSGWFYNHGQAYALEDGAPLRAIDANVLTDEAVYVVRAIRAGATCRIEAFGPEPVFVDVEIEDRLQLGELNKQYSYTELWREDLDVPLDTLHLSADNRLYLSGADGLVAAVEPPGRWRSARVRWQTQVDGDVWEMLAADDRLFVVMREGAVHCFGPDRVSNPVRLTDAAGAEAVAPPESGVVRQAADILEQSSGTGGYAFVFGAGPAGLAEELMRQGDLHVIVLERNPEAVVSLRERLRTMDVYGRTIAAHADDPLAVALPPYLAELIVVTCPDTLDNLATSAAVERLFTPLRPYGGEAFLPLNENQHETFTRAASEATLPGAKVERRGDYTVLQRSGPLPGAGRWTHQYADAANTLHSPDNLAKAPLGILWFGGPSNADILPRHGQGPVPHVFDGRVVLPGVETLSARDVYTGRSLWVREFPGIGHPFTNLQLEERYWDGHPVYMTNLPGANYIGSPYASTSDGIYVRYDKRIIRLDPATGETISEFSLAMGSNEADDWGHISVWENLLITTVEPQIFDDEPLGGENWNATSSNRLVVMDRHTGDVLWTHDADIGIRHNTIITAAEKVFMIDGLSPEAMQRLERRGEEPDTPPQLLALDARTGGVVWSSDDDRRVFGTWLSYSDEHDILIQAGRRGGKRVLADEPSDRMAAHRGSDGTFLWDREESYAGPVSLHEEWIIPGRPGPAVHLLTGETVERRHPLSDEPVSWTYRRTYGCGTLNTSTHLLAFRSGSAGVTDMVRGCGTTNLSGFRSGCTNNMIAADGLLNAPDYTRTCTCSYQNQTSLALIHMPDVEMWTYNDIRPARQTIRRAGLNLAAPGNRMADNGTLWLNYPGETGPSPDFPVHASPENGGRFQIHTSLMDGGGTAPAWVAGSGLLGIETLEIELLPAEEQANAPQDVSYTVWLHFAEPEQAAAGDRVFDVLLQNNEVLSRFDVIAEAGAPNRGVVKQFSGINVRDRLRIDLRPAEGSRRPPLLCGIELVAES